MPESGALTVVGTGYRVAGHVTPQVRSHLVGADRLFYLVADAATAHWMEGLNPGARSLHDCYREGVDGPTACGAMVDRILAAVRDGHEVCAAFYGHPAIFVPPGLAALAAARAEGFDARMLPAISALDCLYADLGFDPGARGCQVYEATDYVLRRRHADPHTPVILLQAGAVGVRTYRTALDADPWRVALLAEVLAHRYPVDHPVTVYELAALPFAAPRVDVLPLARLAATPLNVYSTLFVPPVGPPAEDAAMRARLGLA
jgi:uncharacterized protein YabN with tetrapyrrole methylase and pyrophosphatase domain